MRVDSFVFYSSWLDAIEALDDKDAAFQSLMAILKYQRDHVEPDDLSPIAKALFLSIKPVADSAYAKRMANVANGKKGGRPSQPAETGDKDADRADKKTQTKPKKTQDKANETQAKPKKTEGKPYVYVDVNEDVNEDVNGNVNANDKPLTEVVECSPEFSQALKDFEEMRKSIKKPLTARAKEMILNKLAKLAPDEKTQIEILNQSTMNSWQGVFPLDERKKNVSIDDMLHFDF